MKRDTYRWFIWGTMSLGFLIVFFQRYSLAVIADDLSAAMGLTGTSLSNLGSMYFYGYALAQIPVGILADSWGPRRITSLGMLLSVLASFLFASSHSIYLSCLARFFIGVGMAPVLISILKFTSIWFLPQEFATITGITSVVGNLGGIVATTPFALLVMAIGWRSSYQLLGLFSLLLALSLWVVVRDTPEEKGFDKRNFTKGFQEEEGLSIALKGVLLNPYTWFNFFIFFGGLGVIMSFSSLWGLPFLMHVYDLPRETAAGQILFYSTGVVCGSPLWGYLSDRLQRIKWVMGTGILVSLFLWILLLFLTSQQVLPGWIFSSLFFLMGFFGISVLLSFTAVKEANLPRYAGISTSVINVAPFLGALVLNYLIGWRLDHLFTGVIIQGVRIYTLAGFQQGFLLYVLALFLALVMTVLIKENR